MNPTIKHQALESRKDAYLHHQIASVEDREPGSTRSHLLRYVRGYSIADLMNCKIRRSTSYGQSSAVRGYRKIVRALRRSGPIVLEA